MSKSSLLKLFVYDHCPFCARVRMLLGLKKIDHELLFLANHDEETPIGLVGSKQVPILLLPDGKAMPESMDIVRHLDANFGGDVLLKESADREDLKQWIKDTVDVFGPLVHPRFHTTPFAEFARHASREYYLHKKEKLIGPFDKALERTPELIEKADGLLERLGGLMHTPLTINDELSYDDVDVFTRLRGITIVKGLTWPPKVRAYVDHYADKGDIMLFDRMAQ